MKALILIKNIITNRYLLAIAGFCVWMLFFDRNNYFVQQERKAELQELNDKIEYYQQQIAASQKELQSLQNDPSTLEKYARERYYMKRSNEDIFIIEDPKH